MVLNKARTVMIALLLLALAAPATADVVGEGVVGLRCTEGSDLSIPKKMEFLQTVLGDHFEAYDRVALFVTAEYAEERVNRGRLIAKVFLVKPGGLETKIGKIVGKIRDGEVEKGKIVDAKIESGDVLRWKIKTRGMPKLLAELEDCVNFYFNVIVANEVPQ